MILLSTIKKHSIAVFLLLLLVLLGSCKKEFLDANPRTDQLVPSTLSDCQKLLDNYYTMNVTPELAELSADNYYLTDQFWLAMPLAYDQTAYIWAKDIFGSQKNIPDWNNCYTQVLYANIVLETLNKIPVTSVNQTDWNTLKGWALFARAYALFNISQLFALPYDGSSASTDPGVPIKLSSDINDKVQRSTIQETYDQVLKDVLEAKDLLPLTITTTNRNRPSKPAALAFLSRVYLSMRNYVNAGTYADNALSLYDSLVNYNKLNALLPIPFQNERKEILYQTQLTTTSTTVLVGYSFPDLIVDSSLYRSYNTNDLRPAIFYTIGFTGHINLKGSYCGSVYAFTGLATDEVYLTKAECQARAGNVTDAMTTLNKLMMTRFKEGFFTPYAASGSAEAVNLILDERRKELAFRGIRWTDIRRLNKEERNITLKRIISGQTYMLPANSPLFVLPIPPDVITLGNLQQNVR